MTGPAAGAGFLAGPGAVIAGIAAVAEPALSQDGIAAAITRAAPSRAQQRRLAAALSEDPGLLTSGRPEGPPQVELLVRALQERGARRLVLPRCAHCDQPKRLIQRDGSLRICSDCDIRRRGAAQPCAVCGGTRKVATRDQDGRPRCARCRPWDDPDPVARIAAHVSRLDPGLDHLRLAEVIRQAIPRPSQRHQVLWELDQRPGLLAGDGAHGSPRAVALIQALLAAGASGVVAPACPACGQTVPLSHRLGAARCCRRCYDRWPAARPPASRSAPAASATTRPTISGAPAAGGLPWSTVGPTAVPGAAAAIRRRRPPARYADEKSPVTWPPPARHAARTAHARCAASRAPAAAMSGLCGHAPPAGSPCAGRAAGSECPAADAPASAPSRPGFPPARYAARATASTRPRSAPAPNAAPPSASTTTGCAPGAPAASTCSAFSLTIREACTPTPRRSTTCWPPAAQPP